MGSSEIYNQNGVIIRAEERDGGLVEVELEFDARREDALLYSLASAYIAFKERLRVGFVVSSHTRRRFVLRGADLDEAARAALIESVLLVRANVPELFRQAKRHWDVSKHVPLETGAPPELWPHKVVEMTGGEFLEAFAAALRAAP